jgi:predicted RNA binding protein YcfA (HicA-like mRNA interferase family)
MPRLPNLKSRQVISALQKAGFYIDRQKGSHVQMRRQDRPGVITVPNHPGADVKKGILNSIIAASGLSVEDFLALL